jgi:hypothetical protein
VYDTKSPSSNKSDKVFHNHIYPKPKRHHNAYRLPPASNSAPSLDFFQTPVFERFAQIFHGAICTLDFPSSRLQVEYHCLVQYVGPVPM